MTDTPASVDMPLEAVVIPVADVDRAKTFYSGLGWRLIQRLDQRQFEVAALALGALSAGFLIVTV